MEFEVYAGLGEGHAFTFQQFSLKGSVGFADQQFAAGTYDAVPGDTFSRGASSHSAPSSSAAAR